MGMTVSSAAALPGVHTPCASRVRVNWSCVGVSVLRQSLLSDVMSLAANARARTQAGHTYSEWRRKQAGSVSTPTESV
jgi:hypothetical protein